MKINSVSSPAVKPYVSESPVVTKHSQESSEVQSNNEGIQNNTTAIPKIEKGDKEVTGTKMHGKETEQEEPVIDEQLLKNSIEQANKTLLLYHKYIEREIHPVTKAVMYKLKDANTNEVISEFPPKKIQDMIAKMWELAGLFVDERA